MLEMPDDTIPQLQAELLENRVKINVERKDFAFIDVVSNLPAQGPSAGENPLQML